MNSKLAHLYSGTPQAQTNTTIADPQQLTMKQQFRQVNLKGSHQGHLPEMTMDSQKQLGKGNNTVATKILISKRNSALKGAGPSTVTYDENEHNVMSPPRDTLSFGFKGIPRPGNLKGASNSN